MVVVGGYLKIQTDGYVMSKRRRKCANAIMQQTGKRDVWPEMNHARLVRERENGKYERNSVHKNTIVFCNFVIFHENDVSGSMLYVYCTDDGSCKWKGKMYDKKYR